MKTPQPILVIEPFPELRGHLLELLQGLSADEAKERAHIQGDAKLAAKLLQTVSVIA